MMPPPAHTAPFNRVPPGLTLLRTHEGHTDVIKCLAWAPDGQLLASASADRRIHLWYAADAAPFQTLAEHADYVFSVDWAANGRAIAAAVNGPAIPLWDLERNRVDQSLAGHDGAVFAVAWSPNGRFLASGSCDDTVALWYPPNQSPLRRLRGHTGWVMSVAWSPNGRMLASASRDRSIVIWRTQTGQPEHRLKGHSHIVNSICWSPDGKQLASASDDHTVCLWDTETGRQLHVLEGHTGIVLCVRFSQDGRLLASKSGDGTVRLWRCDTWQPVAVLPEPVRSDFCAGLAFHPTEQQLASLTADERGVRVWQLDYTALFRSAFADTRHYRNAKIVVVGDPGVGKSGLSQVLAGRPWRAASAPGGHQVLNLDAHTLALPDGVIEHRETLLWDLAGAPDYRLATRLHLNEAVAALVVVRPAEGDEAGVLDSIRHWDEVLTQTERTAAAGGLPLHKYLVTVRQNGSGAALSQTRVDAVMRELGFAAFFEVNPRDDRQTGALRQAILDDVDWEALPRVTSNRLFQTIQQFLLARQQTGQLLATVEALYHAFCADHAYLTPGPELQAMFDTGVSRVENRGLIRRLSFGGYLLLRPDRLDAYAAAIIRAAQQAADGLHMLPEEAVLNGRFDVPAAERVADPAQARLLIIATVEELLRHEIALKEVNESGTYLLFPAQAPRERPDRPIGLGYSVVLSFAGPVLSIYTTLAVRLARSRFFRQSAIWKNAATYTAVDGGGCGLSLRYLSEQRGELTLFFDARAADATRAQFEQYVTRHLERRAVTGSVRRRRLLVCPGCGEPLTDSQVQRRQARGLATIRCPVCDAAMALTAQVLPAAAAAPAAPAVVDMEAAADVQRDLATAEMVLRGKIAAQDYDVLCVYEDVDAPAVQALDAALRRRGILPLVPPPAQPADAAVTADLGRVKSVAVCIGHGKLPWRSRRQLAALRRLTMGERPLIIVLLADRQPVPELPAHLRWVDLCQAEPDPIVLLASFIPGGRDYEPPDRWRVGAGYGG